MRTTLVLDDSVLEAARRKALDLDLTLSALVERSLRRMLDEGRSAPEPPFRLPTWGDPGRAVHHEPDALGAFMEDEEVAGLRK